MSKNNIKTDVILKEFWRDNDRFADLFNAGIFQGKQVIHPDSLQEMDTDMSGVIELKNYTETIVRMRDVVKKSAYGVEFVVVGIENQKAVHYAMPLRSMIYDAMGYLKEYQEISKKRKKEGKRGTEDEFLSQMGKEDKFHPIITIVVYYNEKLWDGSFCLQDMIVEMPKEIETIFSDYKMNLIQIRGSEKYSFSNEEVKTVFDISRKIYEEDFDGIRKEYKDKSIKADLAMVIGKITDSIDILEQAAKSKEDVNMCTALENLKKQGMEQGIERGADRKEIEVVSRMLSKGFSIESIVEITGISVQKVELVKARLESSIVDFK